IADPMARKMAALTQNDALHCRPTALPTKMPAKANANARPKNTTTIDGASMPNEGWPATLAGRWVDSGLCLGTGCGRGPFRRLRAGSGLVPATVVGDVVGLVGEDTGYEVGEELAEAMGEHPVVAGHEVLELPPARIAEGQGLERLEA